MNFRIDKQTIADIELFSDKKNNASLFAYYDRTITKGGNARLYSIIQHPTSDLNQVESRKQEIQFFFSHGHLKLNKREIDYIEYYLKNTRTPLKDNIIDATKDSIANKIKMDSDYYTITQGIIHIINLLSDLRKFIQDIENEELPVTLENHFIKVKDFLSLQPINGSLHESTTRQTEPKFYVVSKLDYLFRAKKINEFREILDIVYELDVLQSLSVIMKEENLTLPEYSKEVIPVLEGEGCFHPLIENAITNSF